MLSTDRRPLRIKYGAPSPGRVGAHNNVHIPKESWPNWTWYAIEFGIVLAISLLLAREISDYILGDVARHLGHGNALESWTAVDIHSKEFQELTREIRDPIIAISNWIFYGIVGAIFGGWYIVIRSMVLKKRILR